MLPLTASAARVWFPLRVRSPTPRFSDQMSAVYSERTGLVRERKACRTRSSESPRVIATASARKSLSRAWRPGIHSCMISSTAQNATPPIYKLSGAAFGYAAPNAIPQTKNQDKCSNRWGNPVTGRNPGGTMVIMRAALAMSQAHARNTRYLTEPPLSGIMNQ